MDTRTARDLPANPRHQDLLHVHQVRSQEHYHAHSAELLQPLNLPVVPQLGGKGASLGPTRQLRTSTWKAYIRSIEYCTVSLLLSTQIYIR